MKKIVLFLLICLFIIICGYMLSTIIIYPISGYSIKETIKILDSSYDPLITIKALQAHYEKAPKALMLGIIITLVFVFIIFVLLNSKPKEKLHGDAKWATIADIRKLGLLNKPKKGEIGSKGIIIGKFKNQLLRFYGQQFVSLGAPTRSGKGISTVMTNLLDYNSSLVVADIKLECFNYTSKYRRDILGQEVYLFNPFSLNSHRYNPLYYIDLNNDEKCDNELNDFVNLLYPVIGVDNTTLFFNQLAQSLFIGICYMYRDLFLKPAGRGLINAFGIDLDFTLYGILQLSRGLELKSNGEEKIEGFENFYKYLLKQEVLSPECKRKIQTYFDVESDNTRSGIMSSFNSPLVQFESEVLQTTMGGNDFDFRDLRKKKMTIYIGITPNKLKSAKTILNLFWSQIIDVNVSEGTFESNKEFKYPTLLLMDEFTAAGQIIPIQTGVGFTAGYGLRFLTIYQSRSQLETREPLGYGKEGALSILTNHACNIYFAPKEQADAENLSKLLGDKTVKNTSRGKSSSQGGGSSSRNISDTKRALMLPQECKELPFEEEIIIIDATKPIRANKAIYYSDPYFMNKFKLVSKTLSKFKPNTLPPRDVFEGAMSDGELKIDIEYVMSKNRILKYIDSFRSLLNLTFFDFYNNQALNERLDFVRSKINNIEKRFSNENSFYKFQIDEALLEVMKELFKDFEYLRNSTSIDKLKELLKNGFLHNILIDILYPEEGSNDE